MESQNCTRYKTTFMLYFFQKYNFRIKPYVPRELRRDSSNRILYKTWDMIDIYPTLPDGLDLEPHKHMPIPLGHSEGQWIVFVMRLQCILE